MLFKFFLVVLNLGLHSFAINAQSTGNLVIVNSYKCEDVPNQKVDFTIKPKTFSSPQVVDVTFITPIALGNQERMSLNIELENTLFAKTWQHVVTIEDDFCRVVQTYIGPFAYDLEFSMGIPRGTCPIPKGRYHAVNYTMDFNKVRLQAIPFGNLRVTHKIFEKRDRNVIACIVYIVSNRN